ncbi:MAG TPA: hypothetical protein VGB99_11820, partial [Acidobacteriota bacterium]
FRLRDFGVLRAQDMPEVEVILIEEHEPEGPWGAKGVGEIGLVPTAPAVAAALYAFDGVRRFTLPMKDAPAARAILRKGSTAGAAGLANASSALADSNVGAGLVPARSSGTGRSEGRRPNVGAGLVPARSDGMLVAGPDPASKA